MSMAAQPEPRLPLSRDRILRAALELADEGGIDAVTMRKLGQVLGFEAMSLYNHVANKDDLLRGIVELVLDETDPPLHEHGEQHLTEGPLHEVSAFELGLDLILGGLEDAGESYLARAHR